jgi:hypothetical protein
VADMALVGSAILAVILSLRGVEMTDTRQAVPPGPVGSGSEQRGPTAGGDRSDG